MLMYGANMKINRFFFSLKGYICIIKSCCYYLQYVPTSKPFDHLIWSYRSQKHCTVLDPLTGNFKAN